MKDCLIIVLNGGGTFGINVLSGNSPDFSTGRLVPFPAIVAKLANGRSGQSPAQFIRPQNVCFPNADNFILVINFRSVLTLCENVESKLLVGMMITLFTFQSHKWSFNSKS